MQQERLFHASQRTEAGDQGLLERALGGARFVAPGDVPTQQFPAEAVDHQRQRGPAVTPGPNTAQVGRPALVGMGGPGTPRLDPGPKPDRARPDLPAAQLKHPLHRVLVKPE